MVQSLYDTINKQILDTNGLNIFAIILNNIFKILSFKNKLSIWWTKQKQKFNLQNQLGQGRFCKFRTTII